MRMGKSLAGSKSQLGLPSPLNLACRGHAATFRTRKCDGGVGQGGRERNKLHRGQAQAWMGPEKVPSSWQCATRPPGPEATKPGSQTMTTCPPLNESERRPRLPRRVADDDEDEDARPPLPRAIGAVRDRIRVCVAGPDHGD